MTMTMILFRKMQKTKSGNNDASKVNQLVFCHISEKARKILVVDVLMFLNLYDMTVDTFRLSLNKYKLSGTKTWTWLEHFKSYVIYLALRKMSQLTVTVNHSPNLQ